MKQVKFSQMKDGDKEDYDLLSNFEEKHIESTSDRVIRVLKSLDNSLGGYKVSRLEHSLQTASRALRDNANEEMIVAALLHDIGDEIAPLNHSELAAAVLKPLSLKKQHGLLKCMVYSKPTTIIIIMEKIKIYVTNMLVMPTLKILWTFAINGIKLLLTLSMIPFH